MKYTKYTKRETDEGPESHEWQGMNHESETPEFPPKKTKGTKN